jgi:hypothetical protein
MKILFCHIPKNSGTSIIRHIESQIGDGQTYVADYDRHSPADLIKNRHEIIEAHSFIAGHVPLSEMEDVVDRFDLIFAVVRPPLDRLLSLHRFFVLQGIIESTRGLEDFFYNDYRANIATRNDQCSYLGYFNTFQSVLDRLSKTPNLKLISSERINDLHFLVQPFGLSAKNLPFLNQSGEARQWDKISPEFHHDVFNWLDDDYLLNDFIRSH